MTLDILVPSFNEQESLPLFFKKASEAVKTLDADTRFVFIDDGSTDNTLLVLKELSKSDSRVKFVSFSRNFGKEAALLCGMRHSNADFLCIMDADLQHDPNLIAEMLDAVSNEGFDVCQAKRTTREKGPKSKLSGLFYSVSNSLCDIKIENSAQDFCVMSARVRDAILQMNEKSRFFKGMLSFVGFDVKFIEHQDSARIKGETKWSFKKLFNYAKDGIFAFSKKPAHLPTALGAVLGIFDALYLLLYLILHFGFLRLDSIVHPILIAIFATQSLVLLCLGVLGEYITRIYTETLNRPTYIEKESNF